MPRPVESSDSTSATPQSTVENVQDVPTPTPDQQSNSQSLDPPKSSSRTQRQADNNANTNAPINPAQGSTETTMASSVQDVAASTSDNNMQMAPPMPQSQVVMDVGSSFSTTQSLPMSRTGLIRPSFTSTYTRPEDPETGIQPGIAAASAFFFFGMLAVGLLLVRRWRRHRTRRRARSVLNLVNNHRKEGEYKGVGSMTPLEKMQVRLTLADVESGFVANNAGVGTHPDPAVDDLKAPIAAKIRPDSVKGFKESPFPTIQTSFSSIPGVKFALPYAPAKPSPLRTSRYFSDVY